MTTSTKPTLWDYTADIDADEVGKAIERWHVEHDLACPGDEQFIDALHMLPAGTTVAGHPGRVLATRCRVVMPCGNTYTLSVDYDADLRGDDWHQSVGFFVESAEVVR